jgi:rhodanese-related sulfurtransferase/DNA-binding transcriptional ArsR family regulator
MDLLNSSLMETSPMSSSHFKHDLFNQFARVGKALSNGNRLELIEYIAQGERSVDALAQVAGLTVANTSQHLQQLRQAGLVVSRKQGLKVYYRLSGNDVIELLDALRQVAERHIADVERLVDTYLTVKDDLEAIPREELIDRVRNDLVTVLDVRPQDEYEAGHVPGAVNVPLARLEQYLKKLSLKQEVVAYCRGPHCILAFDAVARLRARGYKARRLQDGFPEWQSAGLPVESVNGAGE